MKKLIGLAAVVATVMVLSTSAAFGQTLLLNERLDADATVLADISLSIEDSGGSGTLNLGTLSAPPELGGEYIIVSATANYAAWNLAIYTDNFDVNVDTVAWDTNEFGGLVHKPSSSTLRLGWYAVDSGDTIIDAASPADGNWMLLYDKSDGDGAGSTFDYGAAGLGFGRYSEWFNLATLGEEEDLVAPFVFDVYLTTYENSPPAEYEGTFVVEMYLE